MHVGRALASLALAPLLSGACSDTAAVRPADAETEKAADAEPAAETAPAPDVGPAPTLGVWPISGTATPDCVQDGFGHRLLGGQDDFHPGLDTCDDSPADVDDLPGNDDDDLVGFPVHAVLAGTVTLVRPWDPAWDAAPDTCPGFCRQGSYVMVRHEAVEPAFGGALVQTVYMHLALGSVAVAEGETVARGQVLGQVGRTGRDIQTTHLHLGLLVGPAPGEADADAYLNPLAVLPYPPAQRALSVATAADSSAFDPGECPAAEGGSHTLRTLTLRLEEVLPSLDVVRLEATPTGGVTHVADLHARIGVGADSAAARDDFEQGCVAFDVDDTSEADPVRHLDVHFGGDFDGVTAVEVRLTDVRGEVTTQTLALP